jgi:hypothetical protein
MLRTDFISELVDLPLNFGHQDCMPGPELEDPMRQPHDDANPDDWNAHPESRPRDTDEPRNFEAEVSDTGTEYDAGFDENMDPLDEPEDINEHGSER